MSGEWLLLQSGDELRVWVTGDNIYQFTLERDKPLPDSISRYRTQLAVTREMFVSSVVDIQPIVRLTRKVETQ
jgi:hypothetical protein